MTGRGRSCSSSTSSTNIRIPASPRWRKIAWNSSESTPNSTAGAEGNGKYPLGRKTAPAGRKGENSQHRRKVASEERAEESARRSRGREGRSQRRLFGNRQGGETRIDQEQHRGPLQVASRGGSQAHRQVILGVRRLAAALAPAACCRRPRRAAAGKAVPRHRTPKASTRMARML